MSIKTYLIAPLTLITSASGTQNVTATTDGAMLSKSNESAAERTVDFVRGGVNAFDHLSPAQRDDVRACRLAQDVTSGIQAAVRAAASSGSGRIGPNSWPLDKFERLIQGLLAIDAVVKRGQIKDDTFAY